MYKGIINKQQFNKASIFNNSLCVVGCNFNSNNNDCVLQGQIKPTDKNEIGPSCL